MYMITDISTGEFKGVTTKGNFFTIGAITVLSKELEYQLTLSKALCETYKVKYLSEISNNIKNLDSSLTEVENYDKVKEIASKLHLQLKESS